MLLTEIRSALQNLRGAYHDTATALSEKAKLGMVSTQSDFDKLEAAKKVVMDNAVDWLWVLLQEVEFMHTALEEIEEKSEQ